jgi:hypothetical protein
VSTWIEQARDIKSGVQAAERAVKSRMRVSESRGKVLELAAELLAEASKSEAVRAWLTSDVGRHFRAVASAEFVARAALWEASQAAVLRDGRAAWPLANAQHLVISAGMHDVQTDTRSLGALHVGILALVALGHQHAAIARALKRDAAQVRETLRLAGAITLAELYAQ